MRTHLCLMTPESKDWWFFRATQFIKVQGATAVFKTLATYGCFLWFSNDSDPISIFSFPLLYCHKLRIVTINEHTPQQLKVCLWSKKFIWMGSQVRLPEGTWFHNFIPLAQRSKVKTWRKRGVRTQEPFLNSESYEHIQIIHRESKLMFKPCWNHAFPWDVLKPTHPFSPFFSPASSMATVGWIAGLSVAPATMIHCIHYSGQKWTFVWK